MKDHSISLSSKVNLIIEQVKILDGMLKLFFENRSNSKLKNILTSLVASLVNFKLPRKETGETYFILLNFMGRLKLFVNTLAFIVNKK